MRKVVFGGAGLKGFAYIGIIQNLRSKHPDITFDEYHGCSIGSIFALLFMLKTPTKDMLKYIKNNICQRNFPMNFKRFLHGDHALFSNDFLKQMLVHFLGIHGFSMNINFETLYKATGKSFHVYSTQINSTESRISFNHILTPNYLVIDAILSSCAVPGLLPGINGLIDGVVAHNFPYTEFDETKDVSFACKWSSIKKENENIIDYFLSCIKSIKSNDYTKTNVIELDSKISEEITRHFKQTGKLSYRQVLKIIYISTKFSIRLKNEK